MAEKEGLTGFAGEVEKWAQRCQAAAANRSAAQSEAVTAQPAETYRAELSPAELQTAQAEPEGRDQPANFGRNARPEPETEERESVAHDGPGGAERGESGADGRDGEQRGESAPGDDDRRRGNSGADDDHEGGQRGQFFAIDAATWPKVCSLGADAAAAYLVLARGTGRDNATTAWSSNAVETYTDLSRYRAKTAVQALVAAELVEQVAAGKHPRYRLPQPSGVARPALDEKLLRLRDAVLAAGGHVPPDLRPHARRLTRAGHIQWSYRKQCYEVAKQREAAPALIWLPNSLVSGADGEKPPVARLRKSQNPLLLRLLVDLYGVQQLGEEWGVRREVIHWEHQRRPMGRHGRTVVWGFGPAWVRVGQSDVSRYHGAAFVDRLNRLVEMGLVDYVLVLTESAAVDAQPLHVLHGPSIEERRVGRAALRAARAMLNADQRDSAKEQGFWLVPVPAFMEQVQLVGLYRLRYRARTGLTAAWLANHKERLREHLSSYEALEAHANQTRELS